ncbi:MAG: hypothetical protein J2P18_20850 [Nocardia sp.]|nr:hypothetical protein [Nocardia sp.]
MSRRAAIAVAALAAGATLALSGCSAGQLSQTASQVPAINGNSATVGPVALRDVRILGTTTANYSNAKGGKAVLGFSAVNQGSDQPDQLVSVTTDLGQVTVTPNNPQLAPGVTLLSAGPNGGDQAAAGSTATPTATPTATATGAHPVLVEISGLTKDVQPGLTYGVTFNFQHAGSVQVQVPVDEEPVAAK